MTIFVKEAQDYFLGNLWMQLEDSLKKNTAKNSEYSKFNLSQIISFFGVHEEFLRCGSGDLITLQRFIICLIFFFTWALLKFCLLCRKSIFHLLLDGCHSDVQLMKNFTMVFLCSFKYRYMSNKFHLQW